MCLPTLPFFDRNNRAVTIMKRLSRSTLNQFFAHYRSGNLAVISLAILAGLVLCLAPKSRPHAATTNTIIRTPAGSGLYGFGGDNGPATAANARLSTPNGVAVDADGNLYIADLYNDRVRKVDTNGIITTFAGAVPGSFSGDGGPANQAGLFDPMGVAVDAAGNVYIADSDNNRIRKVDASGKITTVAGNGTDGFSGDNVNATQTGLGAPSAVAIDAAGNIYIADTLNHRIRKVDAQGIITTIAGTGPAGYKGDSGLATQAELDTPESIAVDRAGNLYIADTFNNVIRRVDGAGQITTFAGDGKDGYGGDNGQAAQATLSSPRGVAADAAGNVYISDAGNDRIRRVDPSGVITTFAGNGQTGYNGDSIPATQAEFFEPVGLTVDPYGVLFVADSYNDRIRMVKGAQFQVFGFSRYVLPAGGSGATINIVGAGLESASVVIGGQAVQATLDQATGNLSVTVPSSLLTSPTPLSVQVSAPGGLASNDKKVLVASGTQLNSVAPVTVSSASYRTTLAPDSIGAMFGTRLATQIDAASALPLPTSLAGTTVYLNGIAAPLFFVSPSQINYQLPSGLAAGANVSVVVAAGDGAVSQGQVQIAAEAPGIYTADASGSGGPAAVWTADGVTYTAVTNPDNSLYPIPAGAYLILFGTGLRNAPDPNPSDGNGVAESLQASFGGVSAPVAFAGAQGGFVGLDQINLQIPAGLAGRGVVNLVITVNGRAANTVQVRIA